MSGLPLRHRGAHLPDFMRQLAAVGGSSSDVRSVRRELAALHPPPLRPDAAPDAAAVFANLAVWIDAAVRASTCHAGPAKLRLYATFLRVLVRELMPDDRLCACVRQIDAYVAYLMDEEDGGEAVASPPKPAALPSPSSARDASVTSYVPVKMAPAPRHKPMAALLSPRVLQQIRRAEPSAADPQSSLKRPTRPTKSMVAQSAAGGRQKTLVELSDHEEAVLELALFFQESVDQLAAAALRSGTTASIDWASRLRAGHAPTTPTRAATSPILTSRWLQLSVEAKKRALTGVKRRLSRQKFFSSSDATLKSKPQCANSSRTTGERQHLGSAEEHRHNGRAVPAPHTKIEPSRYLSLILLCLHETIRCTNVFTQELAQFAWLHLCEEPMEEFEQALEAIERQRATAFDELQRLRSAKEELQTAIRECEARIQRLQTRNMASMRLWQLEQREAEHFAREEQWHGHCKALMLRSLTQLAKEVNVPTWCELVDATDADRRGSGGKRGDEATDNDVIGNNDDVERDQETIDGEQSRDVSHRSPQPDRLDLMGSPRYECLAPGAALLDARLRFHLTYISHLLILCRSYLHLHERRAARDVVEATATTIEMLGEEAGDVDLTATAGAVPTSPDSPPGSPTSASRLITSISRHELHTLRELSEALRAIEVVYAATTGERPLYIGGGVSSTPGRGSCFRDRDAATQFPEALDGSRDGLTSPRAFLRSLAYCTIAATSFAGATSFVPAAIEMTGTYHNSQSDGAVSVSSAPAGSGRRRGSAMFKMQGLTIDPSAEPQPPHVMVRLDRAAHKLPKHMKELLLLLLPEPSSALPPSVLNGGHDLGANSISPFASASPITGAGYNVAALSGDELVVRIQAIYSQLGQGTRSSTSATASPSWSLPASLSSSLQSNLPPPLGISLAGLVSSPQSSWSSSALPEPSALPSPDALVQEIYALFLDAAEGAVAVTEREFVRFFASIQLFMSKATSSSAPPSSAVASRPGGRLAAPVCHEIIHLFAILTKLYYLPAPDRAAALVPRRLFEVVTYSQRMLNQVALDKKRLQVAGGSAFDIWVAASSSLSAPPPSVFYTADESVSAPSLTPSTPMTPTTAHKMSTPSAPPQPYVLLESAKLLLVHAVGISTAPLSILSLEDSARQLEAFAAAATVSLANATTPAPYNQVISSSNSSKAAPTGQYQQPNGLLTDAMIVPLQAAVAVVARAWLKRLDELQRPLRVAFRAALKANGDDPSPGKADEGRLTFSEFLHVMTNGQPHSMALRSPAFSSASPPPWGSTPSAVDGELTYSQLAQLYAAAVSADKPARAHDSAAGGTHEDPSSLLGARWTTLVRIVSDELDLTSLSDRFALADMRSIDHAVIGPLARSGGSGAVAAALQDLPTLASSTRHAVLLPWLLRPPYSSLGEGSASATAAALTKSWAAHRPVMIERFAGAAQAESSAIDGILSWQSGLQRSRLVDKLVPHNLDEDAVTSRQQTVKRDSDGGAIFALEGGSRSEGLAGVATELSSGRKPTAAVQHEELGDEQVGVMWAAFYYLQLEHARAHQLVEMADRAAAKQQQSMRVQKAAVIMMKPPAATTTSATHSSSSAPK